MNAMLRWSPTQQFHIHHDADARFERFLGGAPVQAAELPTWFPAAEGRIEGGSYVIRLALPGVDPKNVNVTLTDSTLTIKGERKIDHDTAGKEYFVREVAYGMFQRDFGLPEGVDAGKIKAKFAHGMLEVSVPKPRAVTPTTIEIKAA